MKPILLLLVALPLWGQARESRPRAVTDPGVVTTRQNTTPAGVQAVFDGRAYGVAFGADSGSIYVLHDGGVDLLDWRGNRVLARTPLKGHMGLQGICYLPEAKTALAASADGKVRITSTSPGAAAPIVAETKGSHAGAMASNGRLALAPLISENAAAVIDVAGRRLVGTVKTGIAPFGAVMNASGTTAYVSNWGGRVPLKGDLTAKTGLGKSSDDVVVDERGIASTGTVTRIDLARMTATGSISVGLHPTALAWDEQRQRLYVANSNSDSVSVIDTAQNRVLRAIEMQPFAKRAAGIAPTALALSHDGATLYVACGGINAIAVVAAREGRIAGLIPTAWYPNGLGISPDGKYLAVSTLLGVGSGFKSEPRQRYVHANRGSASVIAIPDDAQLASYTTVVAENNRMTAGAAPPRRTAAKPAAVPERVGDPSLIEHVVYIIKENRTYDQVFGDMSKGNGDPSLVMFGEAVTPNQHRLADQFVLLDNFYATGGNSGDGHQWVTQANETAYALWPGYFGRSYPFDGSDPIAYSASGFLWDVALARKKSVKIFGEYAGRFGLPRPERLKLLEEWKNGADFTARWHITAPIAPLNKILARNYPSYCTTIPDVIRAGIFLAELKKWVAAASMPNLTVIQLPSNHTEGTAPYGSTPKAMVADNDYALGQIVDALTKTPFWKKMAILVVEDDAQNGVDHVDGHRTVALAVSPYTRRGEIDSTFYSHQSMVKTIELMLGLPTMSLFDLIANDMRNSFHNEADYTGYDAVLPRQSLFEANPAVQALRGAARQAAIDSDRMRWEVPDAAPTARVNRILWGAIRGWDTPYPKTRQAVFSPVAPPDADDDDE